MPTPTNEALLEQLKAASTDVDPMERVKTLHFWMLVAGAVCGFIGQAVLLPGSRISVILTGLGGSLGTIGGIMASLWKPRRDRALIAAHNEAIKPESPPDSITTTTTVTTPLLVLALLSALLPGCTLAQAVTGSYKGLTLAEKVVGEATKQFPALDRNHRLEIVAKASTEQQGKDGLAAWDVTSDRLVKSIQGTDATIKLVRDALAEISKGVRDKAQIAGWIATGIRLGLDLKDLLAAAGVPLKGL